MKNIFTKILGIGLIFIILLSANISFAIDTKSLNTQKQDNEQKIKNTQAEKEKVEEEKNSTTKEVEKLDLQIDEYENQITNLNNQISNANNKIEESNMKLEKAQKDYEEQQEVLEERIVALYEAGETSYLDVLLSSESVTDFISNYYIISEIAQCDVDLLNEIDRQKAEIEKAKKELEENKSELTTAKNDKEKVSSELQVTKNEKANYVAQLSEQEKKLQEQIEEIKKDNVSIDQQIKAYEAELERRIKEEEAKRKAEEQANKNNNSDNKGTGSSNSGSGSNSGSSSGSGSNSGSSSGSGNTGGSSSKGFIRPVPAAYSAITTGWYYSDGRTHGAVDFGSRGIGGQPIYAVADGIVVQTAALTTSYGNYIIIRHYNGLYTLYAHGRAGSIAVSQGQAVKQGQQIMRVGSTGNSSGDHLHFEVRVSPGLYNNRQNPINYLP